MLARIAPENEFTDLLTSIFTASAVTGEPELTGQLGRAGLATELKLLIVIWVSPPYPAVPDGGELHGSRENQGRPDRPAGGRASGGRAAGGVVWGLTWGWGQSNPPPGGCSSPHGEAAVREVPGADCPRYLRCVGARPPGLACQPAPSTAASRCARTPSASASAAPRAEVIETSNSSASLPGRVGSGSGEALDHPQSPRDQRRGHVQQRALASERAEHGPHDLVGRLSVPVRRARGGAAAEGSPGRTRRSRTRPRPRPRSAGRWPGLPGAPSGEQRHPLEQPQLGIAGGVDDRGREHARAWLGLPYRPFGQCLCPHHAGAAVPRGAERREEDERLHPLALGRPDHPPGRDPGELLDRAPGWSRIQAVRCTTVVPRSAWRRRAGRRGPPARSAPVPARRPDAGDRAPGSAPEAFGEQPGQERRAHQAGPPVSKSTDRTMSVRRREARPLATDKEAMAYVIAEPCIGTRTTRVSRFAPSFIHPTPDEPGHDAVGAAVH